MSSHSRPSPALGYWLRSIADLDEQFANGELTASTYQRLRDDYTARAADHLRHRTQRPHDVSEEPAHRRHPRRGLLVIGVLATSSIAALAIVPSATRDRSAGETITGNAATAPSPPTVEQLRETASANPEDPTAHLLLARALLASNELLDALRAYDQAERLDPTNAEPAAYRAWIMLLAGLVDEADAEARRGIAINPDYPDAHLVLTLTLRQTGDRQAAASELQTFLDLTDPDHPMRPMADALAAELRTDQPRPPSTE